jgi:hypothetical protein
MTGRNPFFSGRSRVHFHSSNEDDEAGLIVNVASFDPDSYSEVGTDDGKSSISESVQEEYGSTKDITEATSPFSFSFGEIEEHDREEIRTPQDAANIRRFLQFKSPSAPTSPQTSPEASPRQFLENGETDIPLLDLNVTRTPPRPLQRSRSSSTGTVVENGEREKRHLMDSDNLGKREADRLIRHHTKRSLSKDLFRRISSGETIRSGPSTPEEDGDNKLYNFNSGVLTNLLRLYFFLIQSLI